MDFFRIFISLNAFNMKKFLSILVMGSVFSTALQAQAPIEPIRRYEGTVDYQKTKQPATIMEFKYPPKDLESALEKYIEKRGGKVKSSKGFNYAKQIRLQEKDTRYYDVYYKVEGSGKGANATSTLSVILAEPGEDIMLRDPNNASVARTTAASAGAVGFFGDMGSEVGAYDYDKKVKEQEAEVKKIEKKYSDLEKKRQKLEKDLSDNSNEMQRTQAELEKAKGVLMQIMEQKKN
jgi:hypothetical protein